MQPSIGSRKSWFKPDADFVLKKDHKMEAFKRMKHVVKFTDGYASNISKGVNLSTGKVIGLRVMTIMYGLSGLCRRWFGAMFPSVSGVCLRS